MFILFKKREFSDYISDTFTFLKNFGKHFFKNYFIINGGFLLILCVSIYFIFKIYYEALFSSVNGNGSGLDEYFNNNLALFIGSFCLFAILVIIFSLLNVAYPVLYLKLLEEKKGSDFTTSDIIILLKQNVGRLLLFFLGFLFLIFPLLAALFSLLIYLCFILIGIPLLLIAVVAIISWLNLSFYAYLTQETGFFTAVKIGFNLLKQRFWSITGSTLIMFIVLQVLQAFITWLPYSIAMVILKTATGVQELYSPDYGGFPLAGLMMTLFFLFGIIICYFLNNLVVIHQGIIYYGLREENENRTAVSEIDLIGIDNE